MWAKKTALNKSKVQILKQTSPSKISLKMEKLFSIEISKN